MPILEVSYRDVEKTEAIEELIRQKAAKLEQVHDNLISCRVAVERPQQHQQTGNPYRVRVVMSVPGKEFIITRESSRGNMHDPLVRVLRDAFSAARRQLREYAKRLRGEVKTHLEQQQAMAYVIKLFPERDYGILKTPEGMDIYFHRNSVLHRGFDRLEVGTGVRYTAEEGEKGLQASTVQIVDKPGADVCRTDEAAIAPPLGWENRCGEK